MKEMKFKALLFDFYGTIVEEADEYVAEICSRISQNLNQKVLPHDVAQYWFQIVPKMCFEAYGTNFRLQKDIAVESLQIVLQRFQCYLNTHEFNSAIYQYALSQISTMSLYILR
ncbi:hypothetical protein AMJ74_00565 [candidate division WOR_3 bacterium SM1_77]|uniref:Haloacid dehalogenase n=1 Tax=candidate division WOR_3 bacterium SM1_77 TaxID=1703778 RepID=A0A0S8K366_UNCW3|nr:MAG: hypothetical protein AMJ74_00565 [candidate division WOR_3 bacterium SM1_77]